MVVEWNLNDPEEGKVFASVGKPVYSLLDIPGTKEILIGTATGHVHLVNSSQKEEERNVEMHRGGVFDMKLSNNLLITAGNDGAIGIWKIPGLESVRFLRDAFKSARCLSIHPSGDFFAAGFSDKKIRIYSTGNFELIKTIDAHLNSVFTLTYSVDGNTLVSGGRDVLLRSWDVKNDYEMVKSIPAHTLHINSLSFNPSGKLLASASMDHTVKIWNASDLELHKVIDRAKFPSHRVSVNRVIWMTDNILLSAGDDRLIMGWRVEGDGKW